MHIVGFCGFIGSGKSTAAEHLVEAHGFTRLSFAGRLKDITALTFGWDRSRLEGKTPEDRTWREETDPYWTERLGRNITPRIALQYMGTEVFRNNLHEDIWAHILIAQARSLGPDAKIVIDDVRFVNECRAIRAEGGQIVVLHREFANSEYTRVWGEAFNPERTVELASTLHPSEWNWLKDPRFQRTR